MSTVTVEPIVRIGLQLVPNKTGAGVAGQHVPVAIGAPAV